GSSGSAVRTLEKKRGRQTAQYGSSRSAVTTPASRNDETKGATRTAPTRKASTRRSESKRVGASLSRRTQAAATNASLQLVTKSNSASETGDTVPSSAARWAGNAASR